MIDHTAALKGICKTFIARAEARSLKGKRRDDAAMDFYCGALAGIALVHPQLAQQLTNWAVFVLAMRGYKAMVEEAE